MENSRLPYAGYHVLLELEAQPERKAGVPARGRDEKDGESVEPHALVPTRVGQAGPEEGGCDGAFRKGPKLPMDGLPPARRATLYIKAAAVSDACAPQTLTFRGPFGPSRGPSTLTCQQKTQTKKKIFFFIFYTLGPILPVIPSYYYRLMRSQTSNESIFSSLKGSMTPNENLGQGNNLSFKASCSFRCPFPRYSKVIFYDDTVIT